MASRRPVAATLRSTVLLDSGSCHHRGRADLGPHALARGAHGGDQLRDDPALEPARVEQRGRLVDAPSSATTASPSEHTRDVGHEEDALRTEPDGKRGGGLVGVDVERPGRPAGRRPGRARAASASRTAAGAHGTGSPTRPSAATGSARSPISSPIRPCAPGPTAAHTSALTAASDARTTSSTSGVVTRRPSTNRGTMPRCSSSAVICGPAPWTTTTSSPARPQRGARASPLPPRPGRRA